LLFAENEKGWFATFILDACDWLKHTHPFSFL
jgi:hypothetical protein